MGSSVDTGPGRGRVGNTQVSERNVCEDEMLHPKAVVFVPAPAVSVSLPRAYNLIYMYRKVLMKVGEHALKYITILLSMM